MHYKTVHREGPSFSRIIAGVWRWQNLSTPETEHLIRTSLDCGINTFDHAEASQAIREMLCHANVPH